MVEITRTETVGEDGVLRLEVAGLEVGQQIEVTIRPNKPKRHPGRLKGMLTVPPDFRDPVPGMESYS